MGLFSPPDVPSGLIVQESHRDKVVFGRLNRRKGTKVGWTPGNRSKGV